MGKWFDRGFYSHGVLNLTPCDCYTLSFEGAIIIDVRENYLNNFKIFDVQNILYLPISDFEASFASLPHDKPLIFADSVGLKSREAVLFMVGKGYDNAANMAGGIVDWERDGLPVATNTSSRLSGSCMCQLKPREVHK